MSSTPDGSAAEGAGSHADPFAGIGPEMVSAGVIAAGSGADPTASILATLGPVATRAMQAAGREWRERRAERVRTLFGEVAAGDEGDRLVEVLASNPEAQELVMDATSAAAGMRYPATVIAMGRALREGLLLDGTKLDVSRLVVEALGDLQPSEAAVLDMVVRYQTISHRQVRERLGPVGPGVDRFVATLQAHGLIKEYEPLNTTTADSVELPKKRDINGFVWTATDLGKDAWQRLRDAGGYSEPNRPS